MKKLALIALLLGVCGNAYSANPYSVSKGSVSAALSGVTVTANSTDEFTTVTVQFSGTWTGSFQILGTLDGSNYTALTLAPVGTGVGQTTFTANGIYSGPLNGVRAVVARASALSAGSANVRLSMNYGNDGLMTGGSGTAPVSLGISTMTGHFDNTYTVTSHTATTIDVDTDSSLTCPCAFGVTAYDIGTGATLKWEFTKSASADANLGENGAPVAVSGTAQWMGNIGTGWYIHLIGDVSAANAGSVGARVDINALTRE